jgi:hypothetical protein
MRDHGYGLRRISLPRTPVNRQGEGPRLRYPGPCFLRGSISRFEIDRIRYRSRDVACSVSVLNVDSLRAPSCGKSPRFAGRVAGPATPGGCSPVPEAHGTHPRSGGGVARRELERHRAAEALFYSDGLVEAHNPQREMFGFPRLRRLVAEHAEEGSLVDFLMDELRSFTGDGWEQEDDITLVTLHRSEEL